MKAIHLTSLGQSSSEPADGRSSRTKCAFGGEALVHIEYAPVDYSDLLLANGLYFLNPQLPSVIGGEGAGIVQAIGPGVASVKVWERVTIPFRTFTWAEKFLPPPTVFLSSPFH